MQIFVRFSRNYNFSEISLTISMKTSWILYRYDVIGTTCIW